jgi:ATP-dependent Clp protease ATP-binding subunit ClpA
LLGLVREAPEVVFRFHLSPISIREQIERATMVREKKKISTSVDLPLNSESKRVLSYAAEEAETLAGKDIGVEHLLLGLLREERSFAAELLREAGVRLAEAREQLAASTLEGAGAEGRVKGVRHAPVCEFVEDGRRVAAMAAPLALPRAGEEVMARSEDGSTKTYQVEQVRFILEEGAQRLERIQVLVKRV